MTHAVRWRTVGLWGVFLLLGGALLVWSLRAVPLADLVEILGSLQVWQILVLLAANVVIIALFPWRWWLVIKAQGFSVPYLALIQYRLMGFAASYFSPGQHFGGEPLQILFLRNRHQVPGSSALAAVTLDRAIDLLANFLILVLGAGVLLASGLVGSLPLAPVLMSSIGLFLVPGAYLWAVRSGRTPIGWLTSRFSSPIFRSIRQGEEQLGELLQQQPGLVLQGLGVAGVVWSALLLEYWLALLYLGLRVNALQLVLVVVAGRIALFAPTPGALGALEASQVLAMQTLGFDAAYGIGLSLLIRARDIFFGLVGILLGGLNRS